MGYGKEKRKAAGRGDVWPVINRRGGANSRPAHHRGWPIVEKAYAQYACPRPNFGFDCSSMPVLRLPKFGIWNQLAVLMIRDERG
jgi:hypothetical protein